MFDASPDSETADCIYAIERGELHRFYVSSEDLVWATQWRWKIKRSKNGKKLYACLTVRMGGDGSRQTTCWLHKEICYRRWGRPPTKLHIIADHDDSDHFNCRRTNLHWATPSMNRQNYHGVFAQQLRLAFMSGTNERLERWQ